MFLPALAIFAALAVGSPETVIRATAARMRAAPSADAAIVARLRIDTPVEVRRSANGWSEVTFGDLVGWISSDLVGPALSQKELRDRLHRGPLAEQLIAAERLAARFPNEPWTWRQLADLQEAAGKKKLARLNRARIDGRGNIYFARCHGGQAVLLAGIVDGRSEGYAFTVEEAASEGPAFDTLGAVAAFIGLEAWRGLTEPSLSGTPFPAPRIVVASDYLQQHVRLRLGPCLPHLTDGSLLTTSAFERVYATGAFDPARAKRLVDTARKRVGDAGAVVGVETTRLPTQQRLYWGRVELDFVDPVTEEPTVRSTVSIMEEGGRELTTSGWGYTRVDAPVWLRWQRGEEEALLGVAAVHASEGSWYGVGSMFLLVRPAREVEPVVVYVEQAGPGC